ncbi:8735_t:CDS:2, partial [Cetraspora pellucida]
DRTHITVLLACNAIGTEKLKLLVIGSSIEPQLKDLDDQFQHVNQKILLLLDNASSHVCPNSQNPPDEEYKNSDSEDIEELSPIRTNNHGNRCGHSEVEPTQDIFLELLKYEESEFSELVIDLTENDPNITQAIDTYREMNNIQIPTEERLDNTQIIEIVIAEQLECEEGDSNNSDKEPSKISALEGLNGLKNFILFVKQQMNNNFNNSDIATFQKYLLLIKQKVNKLMKQTSIVDFFSTIEDLNNKDDK